MLEVIRKVIESEIDRRQEAWGMLMDGYNGDIEAYITDYADDYEVECVTTDLYKVRTMSGCSWIVEDGKVERVIF